MSAKNFTLIKPHMIISHVNTAMIYVHELLLE